MTEFSEGQIREIEDKAPEAAEITLYGIPVSELPTRDAVLGAFVLMDEFYRSREKMTEQHLDMLHMLRECHR